MNAYQRATLVQTVADALPFEAASVDCPYCDPSGGCAQPRECTEAVARSLVDLIARDLERMGVRV